MTWKQLSTLFLILFLVIAVTAVWQTMAAEAPSDSPDWPVLSVEIVAAGFNQPTAVTHAGDHRLFVVERAGVIRIIQPDGHVSPIPFLDITGRVHSASSEQGLLGLVFHPHYPQTPTFYVNYTAVAAQSDLAESNGDTIVARFTVSHDPQVADPDSKVELLTIPQPAGNHNAGDLHFGPDGYLYVGMGDGGSAGDPWRNAQNPQTLLGKMLRIDVDGGHPYAIPPHNPFVDDTAVRDEIWALGLRNPWRFSFDRETGDLYVADVGQNAREEINFQLAGSPGGENYGWRCYEGNAPYNLDGCGPESDYVFPIYDYPHVNEQNPDDSGRSVTGGFVYRGQRFPALQGYYVFADFVRSHVWLARSEQAAWMVQPLGALDGLRNPSTFGQGCDGELYVASYTDGEIFQIQANYNSFPDGDEVQLYLPLVVAGPTALTCD